MTVLLAAIDESAAALPVLRAAQRLAEPLEARVEAVHVRQDGSGDLATAIAEQAGVTLRFRDGAIAEALISEVRECDGIALVIGTRGLPGGALPAGHVALELMKSLNRPIVVVPPSAEDRAVRRVLVAVEGDGESATLRGLFDRLGDAPALEVVALHMVDPADIPLFADSPVLEAEAYGREFMVRTASSVIADPSRVHLELRIGNAPAVLREAVHDLRADVVVLAWHRDLSHGHGRLVREMLTEASVPVVLLPLSRHARGEPVPG